MFSFSLKAITFAALLSLCNFSVSHGLTVIPLSIPKSGTHLLQKCLSLLTEDTTYKIYDENMTLKKPYLENPKTKMLSHGTTRCTFIPSKVAEYLKRPSSTEHILIHTTGLSCMWHLPATKEHIELMQHPEIRIFLIIRDPRDQVISFAHMLKSNWNRWPNAVDISLPDVISNLITSGNLHHPYYCQYEGSITDFYNLYIPWFSQNNVCLIRFENLVGPMGGGSSDTQLKEIHKIALHMGLEVDQNKLEEVAFNLFGGTATFREGQVGSWKKELTEKHKKEFVDSVGAVDLVKSLGYSQDDTWVY